MTSGSRPPNKENITYQVATEWLGYNPETGIIARIRATPGRKGKNGSVGHLRADGYLGMSFKNEEYLAHRIAWLLHYGEWPSDEIDHINGIKTDNRIVNLRVVTRQQNNQNILRPKRRNKTGFLGVGIHKDRFTATIRVNKRTIYLGSYDTAEQASEIYLKAKRELHEGNTL
jgi:hypothetical protein